MIVSIWENEVLPEIVVECNVLEIREVPNELRDNERQAGPVVTLLQRDQGAMGDGQDLIQLVVRANVGDGREVAVGYSTVQKLLQCYSHLIHRLLGVL